MMPSKSGIISPSSIAHASSRRWAIGLSTTSLAVVAGDKSISRWRGSWRSSPTRQKLTITTLAWADTLSFRNQLDFGMAATSLSLPCAILMDPRIEAPA